MVYNICIYSSTTLIIWSKNVQYFGSDFGGSECIRFNAMGTARNEVCGYFRRRDFYGHNLHNGRSFLLPGYQNTIDYMNFLNYIHSRLFFRSQLQFRL
ncbi:LOW QUALITY PROTEIN: hypothetical protein TorRG33x02_135880 [Trema orientale]|uniref:Uncharacterized protein n=1 Tax=Trema orientale TaxID=63057 RepID=A0A2P5EYA8_TREOI|nr:LOW QUALITY PROTEIN: hypothetical protein TorRG33x02_135880 [Trema orientale]